MIRRSMETNKCPVWDSRYGRGKLVPRNPNRARRITSRELSRSPKALKPYDLHLSHSSLSRFREVTGLGHEEDNTQAWEEQPFFLLFLSMLSISLGIPHKIAIWFLYLIFVVTVVTIPLTKLPTATFTAFVSERHLDALTTLNSLNMTGLSSFLALPTWPDPTPGSYGVKRVKESKSKWIRWKDWVYCPRPPSTLTRRGPNKS